jgi:hypothetical protein
MSDVRQIDGNEKDKSENKDGLSSDSFGALKCYFYTPKRGDTRGAFCVLFAEDGTILDDVFWVTREMIGAPIDVVAGWRTLNKTIPAMGSYEKSLGEKLSAVTFDVLAPSVRAELLQSANASQQLDDLVKKLCNAFERATHYFMEINLRLERLSRRDLTDAGLVPAEENGEAEAASSAGPQTEEEKPPFPGTLLTCLPVIDPVRGKPISELVPGDLVNVKIQGGVGEGELIQEYLSTMSQDAVFPVEAISKGDDDKTQVLLNISDELHGLISVTKDLRVSVVHRASIKKRIISFNADNVIFFGTLAIAFIVILLAVRILFF